jgi:hypothetical protein
MLDLQLYVTQMTLTTKVICPQHVPNSTYYVEITAYILKKKFYCSCLGMVLL